MLTSVFVGALLASTVSASIAARSDVPLVPVNSVGAPVNAAASTLAAHESVAAKASSTAAAASASATLLQVSSSTDNTPQQDYLERMCYGDPQKNVTSELPCLIQTNIGLECTLPDQEDQSRLNATLQTCLCTGGFFDVWQGCNECNRVHGGTADNTSNVAPYGLAQATGFASAVKAAYCTKGADADFVAVASSVASAIKTDSSGWGKDLFPNKTATSNYFTSSTSLVAGISVKNDVYATTVATFTGVADATATATGTAATATSTQKSGASANLATNGGLLAVMAGAMFFL